MPSQPSTATGLRPPLNTRKTRSADNSPATSPSFSRRTLHSQSKAQPGSEATDNPHLASVTQGNVSINVEVVDNDDDTTTPPINNKDLKSKRDPLKHCPCLDTNPMVYGATYVVRAALKNGTTCVSTLMA